MDVLGLQSGGYGGTDTQRSCCVGDIGGIDIVVDLIVAVCHVWIDCHSFYG